MASNVAQWKCSVQAGDALTVGDAFSLLCEGTPTSLNREKLSLRRPKENPYALRILKIDQLDQGSLRFTATSYVAGQQGTQVVGYGVTDGTNTVEFAPFNLPVRSVITQENNPEGKPYSAVGPLGMNYPAWLWVSLAIVVVVICAAIYRVFRISRQRKAFLKELTDRSSALAPYHQFQKELRQTSRALPVSHPEEWQGVLAQQAVEKLDLSYRWFLAREFRVPAHQWSANLVHREVKKIDRKLFKKAEKPLEVAEREIRRAKKNFAKLSLQDFQQLVEIVRKSADVIYLERNRESRR